MCTAARESRPRRRRRRPRVGGWRRRSGRVRRRDCRRGDMGRLAIWVVAVMGVPVLAAGAERPADLVLTGGNVITLEDARPRAAAIAVRGGRIVAVGSEADVR